MEYYDVKNPKSFGGAKDFSKSWLSAQPAYTLHKPVRYKFRRNNLYSKGLDDFWQADLADMSKFWRQNSGYKYLLFVIDVFSKYLWVFPLKSKKPDGVINAFKSIGKFPNLLMTDKGTEFQSAKAKKFFKGIKYYSSNSPDTKASVAERVIRTIKSRLYRYFTHKGTYKYIDVLQSFVDGYNNHIHRSIGMRPNDVTLENEHKVRAKLYPYPKHIEAPELKVGDKVRIALEKNTFSQRLSAIVV